MSNYIAYSFTRADTATLDPAFWTTGTGCYPFKIVNNVAQRSQEAAFNISYYTGVEFSSDQAVRVTLNGTTGYRGPAIRFNGNSGYTAHVHPADPSHGQITRWDNGVPTQLGNYFNCTAAGTLKFTAIGNTISLYNNEVLLSACTDATYTSGYPGLWQWDGYLSAGFKDDFLAWNHDPPIGGFLNTFSKDTGNNPLARDTWDAGENHDPQVILVGDTYYMFHPGAVTSGANPLRIGVRTTSKANYPYGWVQHPDNPIFMHNQQAFSSTLVSCPRPFQMPDGSFRLYYHGDTDDMKTRAGFATTSAANFPTGWTVYAGNPTFDIASPSIAWEVTNTRPAQVMLSPSDSPDGLWHLIYGGYNGTWRMGHAWSEDGIV